LHTDDQTEDLKKRKKTPRGYSLSSIRVLNEMLTIGRATHLEKCCEYWYYNYANRDNPNPEDYKFPVEMALELLIAADFLDCEVLECQWLIK
jgi:hypothetical protein